MHNGSTTTRSHLKSGRGRQVITVAAAVAAMTVFAGCGSSTNSGSGTTSAAAGGAGSSAASSGASSAGSASAAASSAGSSSAASPSAAGSGSTGASHSVQWIIPTRDTNAFFSSVACEVQEKAPDAGLDVQWIDVKSEDYSVKGYTLAIQQAQAKSPEAIITGVPDQTAMDSTLQQVRDDGMALITYDATITDESIPNAQVATDTVATGALAAQQMAQLTGEKGRFLVIDYAAGNPTTNARAKGFIDEVAAKYPNMEVLPTEFDQADPSKTSQIINATLAKYPDLAGVWFTYNQAAIGGIPALKDAAQPGQIKIISSDADPALVDYLKDGYIQVLLPQNAPVIVDDIIKNTNAALNGETINPVTTKVPPVVVTSDNVGDPEVQKALYRTSC